MIFRALDTETNILNKGERAIGTMLSNPFFPDNKIVCYGEAGREMYSDWYGEDLLVPDALDRAANGEKVLLVLQNAAFDLAYLQKTWPDEYARALPNLTLWDIQQVEYLLSGQRELYPALDDMAFKRGLPLKDDKIKEYWDQGIDTAFIPKELLLDYQRTDVENTRAIFLDQYEVVNKDPALMALVRFKMDDILMTTMMTINGMKFDLELAHKNIEALDVEIANLTYDLTAMAVGFFEPDYDFSPTSNDDVSLTLYGGFYRVNRSVEVKDADGELIYYKSGAKKGLVKTRKEDVECETNGFNLPSFVPRKSSGRYGVGEEDLYAHRDHPFVVKLLRLREISKDAETYYRGYSALVFPDGMIHAQRNHASTATGRLSCSAPNLENVSKDDD